MEKAQFNIVCYGEILWDMLPSGAKPGGAPVNVAFHLQQLGQRPGIISSIGADMRGEQLKALLATHHISTDFLQTSADYPTGVVLATPDADQNMHYDIALNVAWDFIQLTQRQIDLVQAADYFVFGSLAARTARSCQTLFSLLEKASKKVLDINLRTPHYSKDLTLELMAKADILKLNQQELELVSGWLRTAASLGGLDSQLDCLQQALSTPTIIVTLGDQGALVRDQGQTYTHRGYQVKVADTVGSGDAFLAAYLHKIVDGAHPAKALDFAAGVGAMVAANSGAWVDFTKKDIEDFLLKQAT